MFLNRLKLFLLVKLELKIDISGFFFAEKIRVLCGVNHEDLKQLFHVLKLIREAFSKPHNPSSFKKFKPKLFYTCYVIFWW